MALITTHLAPWHRAGRAMLVAVAGFGVAILLFGISKIFWLSALALALTGMFDNISVIVRSTVMQMITPDAIRHSLPALAIVTLAACSVLTFEVARILDLAHSDESALRYLAQGLATLAIFGAGSYFLRSQRQTN